MDERCPILVSIVIALEEGGSHCIWVAAPAFMRGKERFSAPENRGPMLMMRFSAGPFRSHRTA